MSSIHEREAMPVLQIQDTYRYTREQKFFQFNVEWTSRQFGIICDLDLTIYCYDERARFIEKLDTASKRTRDGACVLLSDQDAATGTSNTFSENVKVDTRLVNHETTAILLYLDGGPRNFQFVQNISLTCNPVLARSVIPGQAAPPGHFTFTERAAKDFQGVALAVLYKDGWMPPPDFLSSISETAAAGESKDAKATGEAGAKDKDSYAKAPAEAKGGDEGESKKVAAKDAKESKESGATEVAPGAGEVDSYIPQTQWVTKSLYEPVYVSSKKGKDDKCLSLVVGTVPALEKFRPRLFSNVDELCAALSSDALPGLKQKFTATAAGLQLGQFTEVIFNQLFKTHPKILEPNECAYTVAMIQEMFQQIDYNGDGSADWDEFTTFCIQTASKGKGGKGAAGGSTIDEYVIEYQEDSMRRDKILSPYRPVELMKYVPQNKRFLIIPGDNDKVLMLDDKFRLRSIMSPGSIQVKNAMGITSDPSKGKQEDGVRVPGGDDNKVIVYDIVFLDGMDLYAFSASDHSITICKEQGGIGNRKGQHVLFNRLFHEALHHTLCWSKVNKILCSVADRTIYGWDINKSLPLFHVTRHSDNVTDFIAVDSMDTFITASMDKKIVMWSAHTRRVKAIFKGHRRGVRCISAFDTTLLSGGFDAEARTWDLSTKENIAILKGHRYPIASAKLMCELALSEREYRAVTCDESGEMRLWNIFVIERSSEPLHLPSLQVFEMTNPSPPLSNLRFIATPCDEKLSTGTYSNIVAVGTKMMNFIPEKNTKEFVPPSCSVFNEAAAEIGTCVGKNIFKYDVPLGQYRSCLNEVHTSDLTSICLDGPRGRRAFVGCQNGDILLINYMSGILIDKVSAHKKEINCIVSIQAQRNSVYTAGADGNIVICEEFKGDLHVHSSVDEAFGEGIRVTDLRIAPSIGVMVAASTGTSWGIWNSSTCKRIALFDEANHGGPVSKIAILGASRDEEDLAFLDRNFGNINKATLQKREKEKLITIAVGVPVGVHVYTLDVTDMHGVNSYMLRFDRPSMYINEMTLLRFPEGDSVNYTKRLGKKAEIIPESAVNSPRTDLDQNQTESTADEKKEFDIKKKEEEDKKKFLNKKKDEDDGKYKDRSTNADIAPGALTMVVATDEGIMNVWDVQKIRSESEEKYRKAHPNASKKKGKKKANANRPESSSRPLTTGTDASRPGTADTNDTNDSFLSEMQEQLEHGGPPVVSHEEGGNGNMLGEGVTELASTVSTAESQLSIMNEFESQHFFTTERYVKNKHHGHHGNAHGHAHGGPGHPVSHDPKDYHLEKLKETMKCCRSFPGHLDSIGVLVPMSEHGCFITASHDGFHRVWNLDNVCLGEMQLPNLTDKQKSPKEPIMGTLGTLLLEGLNPEEARAAMGAASNMNIWKFILERIAITTKHEEIAAKLTYTLDNKIALNNRRVMNSRGRQSGQGKGGLGLESINATGFLSGLAHEFGHNEVVKENILTASEEEEKVQEQLRSNALGMMNEEIGPREDGPPITIPTKEEIKLLEMKEMMSNTDIRRSRLDLYGPDKHSQHASDEDKAFLTGGGNDDNSVSLHSTHSSHPRSRAATGYSETVNNHKEPKIKIRNFGGRNALWTIAGEPTRKSKEKIRVPPPFSEESLDQAQADGILDEESHKLLRHFATTSDKVHQYTNSTKGTILLRSASLSTSIALPAIESMRRAEISFGVQKEYYSNAEKCLNERDNIKKDRMRQAITLGRIEHNVKKIGSMMEVLNPLQVDDVKLPSNPAHELKIMMEKEDKIMQVRLMHSATLLPHEPVEDVLHHKPHPHHHHGDDETKAGSDAGSGAGSRMSMLSQIHDPFKKKRKPLDKNKVTSTLNKVKEAVKPEHHAIYDEKYAFANDENNKQMKQNLPLAAKQALEKKVRSAIRDEYYENIRQENITRERLERERAAKQAAEIEIDKKAESEFKSKTGVKDREKKEVTIKFDPEESSRPQSSSSDSGNGERGKSVRSTGVEAKNKDNTVKLDTRQLLPYYKAEDVRHFMDIFTKVDVDFSGDLDMNEWIKLFSSINDTVPINEARSIFMKFKNEDGFLTVNELVPVVFSKANKEQIKLITKFCQAEVMTGVVEKTTLTFNDVDQLFEIFDLDNINFVSVNYIKERIAEMNLPEAVNMSFLGQVKDIDDDEMLNHREFNRLFKAHINKTELMNQRAEEQQLETNTRSHGSKKHSSVVGR